MYTYLDILRATLLTLEWLWQAWLDFVSFMGLYVLAGDLPFVSVNFWSLYIGFTACGDWVWPQRSKTAAPAADRQWYST